MRNKIITSLGVAALFVLAFLVVLPVAAVEGQAQMKGEIAGIDLNEHTIFISSKGRIIPVEFSPESMISRDGQAVSFDSLAVGERLEVTFNPTTNMVANAIAREALVQGQITEVVRTFATSFVTVTSSAGKQVTVRVTAETKLEREGKRITIKDIRKGDFAKAYYNLRTMDAVYLQMWPSTKISASGTLQYVKGMIFALRWTNEAKPSLLMDVMIGPKQIVRYKVTTSTIVEINGLVMTREQLAVGDQVTVTINRFTNVPSKVSAYRVVLPVKLSGVITNITIEGSILPTYVLQITQNNFRRIEVEVIPSTKLTRNNQRAFPSDLQIGDYVSGSYEPLGMTLIQLAAWSTR